MKATNLSALITESDVEQKFVYPLLTDALPFGLEIPSSDIHTKHNIRKYEIDKGSKKKIYYPDFLIVKGGFPLVVIEAKKPSEDLLEGYREARLYACELNASFPSGVNPVSFTIAVNGKELIAGKTDYAEPEIKLQFSDIAPHSAGFKNFTEKFNNKALIALSKIFMDKDTKKYYMPRRLIGGKSIEDEILPKNTFGEKIYRDINRLFIPDDMETRTEIAKYAYVNSNNRDRYYDPINKIMRAAKPRSIQEATLISDSANPRNLVDKISERYELEHKVLILIGGAGCGKTTFVDHLKEVALTAELKSKTAWIHFNMNRAPISREEIYEWLRKEIILGAKGLHPSVDFDEIDNIKKLYAVDIKRFKKSHGRLLKGDDYNKELSVLIKKLEQDSKKTADSYCRYCGGDKGNLLIFVLDNCDKRTREDQLLMFEVTQWLTREFKALVILPLREETYDDHRHEAPLDTVLKDLVFRIDPPGFEEVLRKRIDLALGKTKIPSGKLTYDLPHSMRVEYKSEDQGKYLIAIARSIFYSKNVMGRLILGISDGNIRAAFEIFLQVCNSSYLSEDEIFKACNEEKYHIKPKILLRILLRQNRRFYKSQDSYLKNIFFLTPTDELKGSYFYRVLILLWLRQRMGSLGSSKQAGFFSISDIVSSLAVLGLSKEVLLREIEILAKAKCIVSEDFKVSDLEDSNLIKIASSGFIHLELISDIDYWAAIAEETNFTEEAIAKKIAARIVDSKKHLTLSVARNNAVDTLNYLIKNFNLLQERSAAFVDDINWLKELNLEEIRQEICKKDLEKSFFIQEEQREKAWKKFRENHKVGEFIKTVIKRETAFDFFVDLAEGISSRLPKIGNLKVGAEVTIRLTGFDDEKKHIYSSLSEPV